MFLFFCQYPTILAEHAGSIKDFLLNDQEKLREQSGKSRARSGVHAGHGIRLVLLARGTGHIRGSQWGGGFYGYRLKFWLFYGYQLIFFSYG